MTYTIERIYEPKIIDGLHYSHIVTVSIYIDGINYEIYPKRIRPNELRQYITWLLKSTKEYHENVVLLK